MALNLQQTDTAADNGLLQACANFPTNNGLSSEMVEGGTAGTTETNCRSPALSSRVNLAFQSDVNVPGVTNWQAGDWVVRIDVTTANVDNRIDEIHICERTAGGTFNTVAADTTLSQTLGTAQVYTFTINQASDFTPAGTDSTIYITVTMFGTQNHGNADVGVTPSQVIDTPISTAAPQNVSVPPSATTSVAVAPTVKINQSLAMPAASTTSSATTVTVNQEQMVGVSPSSTTSSSTSTPVNQNLQSPTASASSASVSPGLSVSIPVTAASTLAIAVVPIVSGTQLISPPAAGSTSVSVTPTILEGFLNLTASSASSIATTPALIRVSDPLLKKILLFTT